MKGYWEKRQAQMMYEHMEDAEALSQELADIYAKASRQLNYKIDRVYDKFKSRHGLTDKEARKLLNSMKDSTSLDELKKALAKDPKNADLLAEMESGAYRARIERMEQLQTEIDLMMRDVYNQEKKVTTSHYVDLASNSYYREIYEVQKRVGFQFSFSAVDPKAVDRLLRSNWSGENYSTRIWKNTQGLAKELKEQMILGMLTGKTEEEMSRELANKYATGAFEARRLVRTESNFVNGQMQLAAYEECDAEQYEFVAVLDLRTSKQCQKLDGQVFYTKDAEPGKNMNPMHPFCRSTTIIHLGDGVEDGLKRRARNPVTGKNEFVPAGTNYPKWYAENVANNPKAIAVEKMLKNRESDRKQYELYRKLLGKREAGKNFTDFQEMKYNDPEEWEDVKKFANYMRKYPDSSRPYYNIMRDLKEVGIDKGVSLPAKTKRAYILKEGKRDPNHLMKRMLERHITDDEIRGYVDNAKVMFSQWGGNRQLFITKDGAAVITKSGDDWIFKTAWSKADFDEESMKILEVMRKYGQED